MKRWSRLTAHQQEVLRAVSASAGDLVAQMPVLATTLYALRDRGLVTVAKASGVRQVTITEAGLFYLRNGYHPDRPTGATRTTQKATTRTNARPLVPGRTAEPDEVTAETLMKILGVAPHHLRISDPDPTTRATWRRAIHAAKERDLMPAGTHLCHVGRDHGDLVIELVPGAHPDRKYRTPRPKTDLPAPAGDSHPVVAALRRRPQLSGISAETRGRAMRLIQALVGGWTQRGNSVKLCDDDWVHLEMSVRQSRFVLKMSEESELRDRMPSLAELDQQITYPWQRVRPQRASVGTGKLRVELDHDWSYNGRRRNWADRSRWTLEDKIEEILAELDERANLDDEERTRKIAEEQQKRRSWETAMARAKMLYTENVKIDTLEDQLEAWEKANRIRQFCAAAEAAAPTSPDGHERTAEWLRWARRYADQIDPTLSPLEPPTIPEPSPQALRPFLGRWIAYGPDRR